jgi:hypothetical protein
MVKMGNVWDRTTGFLSDELAGLMPVVLLAFFVPNSIIHNLQDLLPGAAPRLYWAIWCAVMLLALCNFWGQLTVIALALDPERGRQAGTVAMRRLPSGIAVGLVVVLATLVLLLPIAVLLGVYGIDMAAIRGGRQPTLPPAIGLGLGLYVLALVPIGLWLLARLSVVVPVIVAERRGLGAIARGFRLTRGVALKIIGVLILYYAVSWVAQWAAQAAFGTIFRLVVNGDGTVSLASVLTTIVVAAVESAFSVLGAAFTAKLYLALSVERLA